MYIAKNYETDSGLILTYSVALYIGYNGEYQQNIINNILLPSLLLPELQWISPFCATKQVTARSTILTLLSGDFLQISYPFRAGTLNWFAFWEQLQSPEIVSMKSFGEKTTDKFLRKLLGIT
jgi:hypothetical protein